MKLGAAGLALLVSGLLCIALAISPAAPQRAEDLQMIYFPGQLQLASSEGPKMISITPLQSLILMGECQQACRTNKATCERDLEYTNLQYREHCRYLCDDVCMPKCKKLPRF
eukprot:CAMPEP_0184301436 /NCGR_PEP_ID=MMETSP1049-20130417/11639_1 /TAXON_ID=77928 /ORGANISM="Proteomonas sulcata, Strain CCMP704" /LENGTH=111 /DNA_ID=CAMNT_0026612443 /DNA_START=150 /DNA_END=485 /DNA_ORIENTATION=-